ncbi:hypothetical protein [Anaerotalea alkaliphila]|uniref:Lipoprotein n=1 Tax=Anaerotalea alkaliphila TaxID=2662126 RepID=A0A7X5HUC8_9FIRM|nr:hypothetical protein [Anaerotalea alkaliphila]NDL66846.1 hypothetical protein [Anaerotalea alkaliphila]
MLGRKMLQTALLVLLVLLLAGCVPGDGRNTLANPAGFFWGVWHGWLAPVSLIIGFFDRSIRVYEVHNTGWFYDLGFYMAVISGFGGVGIFRSRKKKD